MSPARDNHVKADFLTYPVFAAQLIEKGFSRLDQPLLPKEVIANVRQVIVTGNGDSYAAALATQDFCSLMLKDVDYHVLRTLDVSRHYRFSARNPGSTLVVVISVSGSGARSAEAIQRARNKGCLTLADYVHLIDPPEKARHSPASQSKSYLSTLFSLQFFGLASGLLLNTISREKAKEHMAGLLSHVKKMCGEETLTKLDDQIWSLAQTWQNYLGYGLVGGGADFATACFGSAKFFEFCGSLNCLNDSEDWCHIDYFQTNRPQLGEVVVAMTDNASYSRTMETTLSMSKSRRNVLLITDSADTPEMEGVSVCVLPKAENPAFTPMMNFIPLVMLPNYIALNRNYPYFGGMDESNPLFSQEGGINTIKSSRIVLDESI